MPVSPAADPALRINWNPFTETAANLRIAHASPAVFNSILGISWLWFFGSIFLTSFTPFARENLGGDEGVVTFLLAVFSVGIGTGSLVTERLSGRKVEIGLVPFGSIGMTVFAVDLYLASRGFEPMQVGTLAEFLRHAGAWRIVFDLAALSFFGGLYSVPLYALIQSRAEKTHVARIVAANNILNAVFMVVASVMAAALLSAGLTIPQLFLVTAVLNAAVAVYIYRLVPEFLLRFVAWLLVHTLYRVRSIETDRIPDQGAAVLVCNHVSFVDAIVIMGESPRPIRFVMDHRIFRIPLMNWFFRNAKAIAIAPAKEDPTMLEKANVRIDAALADGDLVCIFPEGRITDTGEMYPFKQGVRRIVERNPVPVIPMALRGLWGSFFSRFGGAAFSQPIDARLRRGLRSRVEFVVGEPVPAAAGHARAADGSASQNCAAANADGHTQYAQRRNGGNRARRNGEGIGTDGRRARWQWRADRQPRACRVAARTAPSRGACSTRCWRTVALGFEGISGASAGAMNAVVLAEGWRRRARRGHGPAVDGARSTLRSSGRRSASGRRASGCRRRCPGSRRRTGPSRPR